MQIISIHCFRKTLKFKNIDEVSVTKNVYDNNTLSLKYTYILQIVNNMP